MDKAHMDLHELNVSDLELSTRTSNVLQREGISTIREFLDLSEANVMNFKNAGRRTWLEIQDLQRYLNPDPEEVAYKQEREARIDALNSVHTLNKIMNEYSNFRLSLTSEGRLEVWESLAPLGPLEHG